MISSILSGPRCQLAVDLRVEAVNGIAGYFLRGVGFDDFFEHFVPVYAQLRPYGSAVGRSTSAESIPTP